MSGEERTRDRLRRRRTAAVVSVAAAVLLAGGGGAYLATNAMSGSDDEGAARPGGTGSGTPPPLALDGYSDTSPSSGSAPPGIAPGEPDPNGTRYKATGDLPAGPGKAPVYRARGEVTAAEAGAVAEALDVQGRPVRSGDAWKVGPAKDGSGPSLQVSRAAPGTWTYSRYAPSTGGKCGGGTKCADPTGGGSAKDAVSEAAAKRAAAPVLKALGQDDAKLDAGQLMGATRVVNADPAIGGLPTYGWSTGIQVGSDGQVVGGSGQLKAPDKGATYPTVGAREALERMNGAASGGRVSVGGCASAVPLGEDEGKDKDEGKDPGKTADCASAPPEPSTVAVTGATFGLAAHTVAGRQALVPSWLFEVRPSGADAAFTVTYPAVEPKYLAAPKSSQPDPRPSDPSDKAGGDTRTVHVQGYSAKGRTLTLHFTGGVCAKYAASADESGGRVSVKVTETQKKGTVCVELAKFYTLPVTLDEPLGERKVVAADGAAVPYAQKNAPGGVEPAPRD
ncbi:hypothetical protein [Streptomyces endophyticus]|uniref:Large membrane protein n=1 Tax=Streptomyces endophyticus TaxID=714166 RepID=A0ABU6FK38_9ACTN|nr:hypothetical protein [Streptomyces endophyticus]MEB8344313.1 hypothetical protein [Streptomyces endophyticus]